jgi:hypothetical protein
MNIDNINLGTLKYFCEVCNYKCSYKRDYNRHLSTAKHQLNIMLMKETNMTTQTCDKCNKTFESRSGLWKHYKKCQQNDIPNIDNSENVVVIVKETQPPIPTVVFDFVKQITENNESIMKHQVDQNNENNKTNQEFQLQMFNQMMEFMKQQCSITNNINNGQIQNNTHFNLPLYLNETCKNAMTINQFLDYLQPTIEELEATAHLGYVESISRIIMRGFKNLEEEELPFHCTDLKREHIYIKNPDKEWVKETNEKPLLLRFVKEVARRNFNNIFAWQKENPTWSSYSSKKNDLYNSIVANAMSGATEKEQNDNYEKIMKNIMKNITIDKSKKNK